MPQPRRVTLHEPNLLVNEQIYLCYHIHMGWCFLQWITEKAGPADSWHNFIGNWHTISTGPCGVPRATQSKNVYAAFELPQNGV